MPSRAMRRYSVARPTPSARAAAETLPSALARARITAAGAVRLMQTRLSVRQNVNLQAVPSFRHSARAAVRLALK